MYVVLIPVKFTEIFNLTFQTERRNAKDLRDPTGAGST